MATVKFKGNVGARITVNEALLKAYVRDLENGSLKLPDNRIRLNDDQQPGLQIHVYKNGDIVFHAGYHIAGSRPVVKIGNFPSMSLQEAREMTKLIRDLAEDGVDMQDGFLPRTIRELRTDGIKWRPWPGYKGHGV